MSSLFGNVCVCETEELIEVDMCVSDCQCGCMSDCFKFDTSLDSSLCECMCLLCLIFHYTSWSCVTVLLKYCCLSVLTVVQNYF